MTHLSPEELIDLAEGAQPHHAHLDSCAACRHEVAGIRALMAAVVDVAKVDVPEPSPLFWDHLSSRVRDAVAIEAPPSRTRFDRWAWVLNVWSWRFAAPVAALAAATLVVMMFVSSRGPGVQQSQPADVASAGAAPALGDAADTVADPAFTFVADLTSDMDTDTALDAGLLSDGSAEHAVTHLNEGELRELARLLTEEIARVKAS